MDSFLPFAPDAATCPAIEQCGATRIRIARDSGAAHRLDEAAGAERRRRELAPRFPVSPLPQRAACATTGACADGCRWRSAASGARDHDPLAQMRGGRGVEAPMPVVLLGALGGMATAGILGMFLGSTLLAVGYQILMGWVAAGPNADVVRDANTLQPPSCSAGE
jgi:hypothetical protein